MRKVWILAGLLVVLGLACGGGDEGEECNTEGKVGGECDDGLVCGRKQSTGGDLVCLKQCSAQSDCSGDQDCNGIPNSALKGCQPKNGTQH